MRVLLVTSLAYPRVGGVSTYIDELMGELKGHGHQVDLIARTPDLRAINHSGGKSIDQEPIRQRIEPRIAEYFSRQFPAATPWVRWRELERIAFETALKMFDFGAYDVIHAQDPLAARTVRRTKPCGVPLVVTFHNIKSVEWRVSDPAKPQMEMDFLEREESVSAHGADAVIFPCHWLADQFFKFGLPSGKKYIIPYGISPGFHKISTAKSPGAPPVIACPARLVPIKGHLFLLDALQRLKRQGHRFQCWFIGDGFLKRQLMARRGELGLQAEVQFLGDRHDMDLLLALADIIVLPTLHDTFPFAVIEAQAAGKPAVASRIGGIPEMITPGVDGLLVAPADSLELSETLARLIRDPSLRLTLGHEALRRATGRWSITTMGSRTLSVYENALPSSPAEPVNKNIPDEEILDPLAKQYTRNAAPRVFSAPVEGRITFHEKVPPSPLIVHLLDASGVLLQTTRTDARGDFGFGHLPKGRYALMAQDASHEVAGSTFFEVQGCEPTYIAWPL